MSNKIQTLEWKRTDAMLRLRLWWERNWDRNITEAPMWPEYLATCAALEKAREGAE